MSDGVRYIKIAKIDANGIDQTNTLQSLEKLIIPFSTGEFNYQVLSITEKPTFFLYYVSPEDVEWADRADLKYDFTGSLLSAPLTMGGYPNPSFVNVTIEQDSLGFWDDIDYKYVLKTYPQKNINIFATGSISVPSTSDIFRVELRRNTTTLSFQQWDPSSTDTASFSLGGVITDASPGDEILLQVRNLNLGGTIDRYTFHSNSFLSISSSNAIGQQVGLIAEPYFGSNDFKRALDCQPLLNNAERVRKHNLFMDVDYSAGSTEPVNFDLLISGSATRAEVQFSNYTTRRHIIPRYEGSRTISQKLNSWTEGDTGTFGKSPTAESLKRMVIYSDSLGGWPPERMNASAIFVKYLIDENGDVKIPNTSENSLQDVQGTFQTGERVLISSETPGSGEAIAYRNIIRGGQRIEPILYTQSGSAPGAQYTDIELVDILTTQGSATANYQNQGSTTQEPAYNFSQRLQLNTSAFNSSLIDNTDTAFGLNYGHYDVPLGAVQEGVSLKFQLPNLTLAFYTNQTDDDVTFVAGVILKKETSPGVGESFSVNQQTFGPFSRQASVRSVTLDEINFTVPASDLVQNQQFSFELVIDMVEGQLGRHNVAGYTGVRILGGSYNIFQTPIPTALSTPSTGEVGNIWGYFNKSTHPNVITSSDSSPTLSQLYGDPNVRQKSTPGSGFNPIALPWSIKQGDEFRFEGDERFTFMVKDIYGPNEGSGSRISATGSIEVQFDKNLPVNALTSSFNLDHFLIRRYVDDASQVIIEGFAPEGSSGPYIITPEYSTPKINKGIDEYITILTEKNLLS